MMLSYIGKTNCYFGGNTVKFSAKSQEIGKYLSYPYVLDLFQMQHFPNKIPCLYHGIVVSTSLESGKASAVIGYFNICW